MRSRFEHVTVGTKINTEDGMILLKGYNGSLLYADKYEYDESYDTKLVLVDDFYRLTKSELAHYMKEVDGLNHDLIWDEPEEDPDRIPDRIVDIESFAADLYDGGWRAYDRYELIEDYNLSPDDADDICEKLAEYDELERVTDISGTAAALYDGGWRADDRDQMIKEYNMRPDDADAICEKLAEYEENENE